MFIAAHSLKDSLKSVLLNTEISATMPKKGKKTWDTMKRCTEIFTKIGVQTSVSELVKLQWDLHSPVVCKHFEQISSYNLFQILTQTSDIS